MVQRRYVTCGQPFRSPEGADLVAVACPIVFDGVEIRQSELRHCPANSLLDKEQKRSSDTFRNVKTRLLCVFVGR